MKTYGEEMKERAFSQHINRLVLLTAGSVLSGYFLDAFSINFLIVILLSCLGLAIVSLWFFRLDNELLISKLLLLVFGIVIAMIIYSNPFEGVFLSSFSSVFSTGWARFLIGSFIFALLVILYLWCVIFLSRKNGR